MNKNNPHINYSSPKNKSGIGIAMVLLLIFVNFTLTISYINVTGTNITITEIVEEHKHIEHNHNLIDALINNFSIIASVSIDSYKKIMPSVFSPEVQTPPPKKA